MNKKNLEILKRIFAPNWRNLTILTLGLVLLGFSFAFQSKKEEAILGYVKGVQACHTPTPTPTPTVTLTPTPTPTPTPTSTPSPSPTPTVTPTPTPTVILTSTPTPTPTPTPTSSPSPTPTVTPTVVAKPPVCQYLNISPDSGDKDLLVTAIVGGNDEDGSIVEYRVNWGDGSDNEYQSEDTFTHTYTQAGEFTIAAWVKDNDGNWTGGSGDCEKEVEVDEPEEQENEKPECEDLTASIVSGQLPLLVKFNVEASDANGSLTGYWFDFGDGVVVEQDGPYVEHIYEKGGDFVAQARVKDNDNQWSDFTSSCEVKIETASKPQVLGVATPSAAPRAGWSVLGVIIMGLLGLGLAWL